MGTMGTRYTYYTMASSARGVRNVPVDANLKHFYTAMKEREMKQAQRFSARETSGIDPAEFRKRMEAKRPIDFVTGHYQDLGQYIDVIRNEKEHFLYVRIMRKASILQKEALISFMKRRIPNIDYLKISRLFRKVWSRTDISSYEGVLIYISKALVDSPNVTLKFEW